MKYDSLYPLHLSLSSISVFFFPGIHGRRRVHSLSGSKRRNDLRFLANGRPIQYQYHSYVDTVGWERQSKFCLRCDLRISYIAFVFYRASILCFFRRNVISITRQLGRPSDTKTWQYDVRANWISGRILKER